MAAVHSTSNRKYIYPSDYSVVPLLCSHIRSCNKCFQTVHHTMSTRHHSRLKTCSFRWPSRTFPVYFTGTSGHRADVAVVSFITRTCFVGTRKVSPTSSVAVRDFRWQWRIISSIEYTEFPSLFCLPLCLCSAIQIDNVLIIVSLRTTAVMKYL